MVTNDIDRLLARYFAGELSPEDEMRLEKWLAESEENESYFFELTSLFQNLSGSTTPNFDINTALDDFKKHIGSQPNRKPFPLNGRNKTVLWLLSAAAMIAAIIFVFNTGDNNYTTINKQGRHILADNVEVDVDKGEIRFAQNDTIHLKGAARFALNSEETGSKIVKTGGVYIKDIGTSFAVDASTTDSIHVSVTEGEVLFFSDDNPGISLRINESGYYLAKDQKFYKIVLRGNFRFDAATMQDVVDQLSEFYGQPVTFNDAGIKDLAINVTFEEEDLSTILDIISTTLDLDVEYKNSKYVVQRRHR